jgi:hypothetical protein
MEEINLSDDEIYLMNQLLCTIWIFSAANERFRESNAATKVTFSYMLAMVIVLPYFIVILTFDILRKLKSYFRNEK